MPGSPPTPPPRAPPPVESTSARNCKSKSVSCWPSMSMEPPLQLGSQRAHQLDGRRPRSAAPPSASRAPPALPVRTSASMGREDSARARRALVGDLVRGEVELPAAPARPTAARRTTWRTRGRGAGAGAAQHRARRGSAASRARASASAPPLPAPPGSRGRRRPAGEQHHLERQHHPPRREPAEGGWPARAGQSCASHLAGPRPCRRPARGPSRERRSSEAKAVTESKECSSAPRA